MSKDTIGAYTIGAEIGKGSFATVYKCLDNRTHQAVAIKLIVRSKLKLRKLVENLEVEISILKTMRHPHIVMLLDYHQTALHFHLVMDYCLMGDLLYFIRKRHLLVKSHPVIALLLLRYPLAPALGPGLNTTVVIHFLQQLALALEFLREKLLVHRDIKPQNLLLCPPAHSQELFAAAGYAGLWELPILKIADFGFARVLPLTLLAETLCGLPLYMAPEILRYEKYNAKADLWLVGAVLYEMSCGRPPFKALNHIELLKTIERAQDRIKFPLPTTQEVPEPLKRLIRLLLRYNATERILFAEFFADELVTTKLEGNNTPLAPEMDENLYILEYILPLPQQERQAHPHAMIESKFADKQPLDEARIMQLIDKLSPQPPDPAEAGAVKAATALALADLAPAPPLAPAMLLPAPDAMADYVVVEKRAVEVNAVADAITHDRRASGDQGGGAHPALQIVNRRRPLFDRRMISLSPLSALLKAIGLALHRLFGTKADDDLPEAIAEHTGATFSTVISAPPAVVAQHMARPPVLPPLARPLALLMLALTAAVLGDAEVLQRLELLATKAHAIILFADVKFSQLVPMRPDDNDDGDGAADTLALPLKMVVQILEEGVALYVKTLLLLARAMEVALEWWYHEGMHAGVTQNTGAINELVQWVRDRFNEALERAEYLRLRLEDASHDSGSSDSEHALLLATALQAAPIIALKLIFERGLEMLRNAAINELVKEDLKGCELAYLTAIWMLEALLDDEGDDEAKLDSHDRQMVEKFIVLIGNRLAVLRKKLELMV